MKLKMTGLAVVAVAAVAAGCGGGDDEEALSKAEFVTQGNKICTDFNTAVDKDAGKAFAGLESASDVTPDVARKFFDAALPKFDDAVADLDALGAPEGDEDTVQAIIDAGKSDSKAIEDVKDDDAAITKFVTQGSATPDFDKKAEDYGLTECGTQNA